MVVDIDDAWNEDLMGSRERKSIEVYENGVYFSIRGGGKEATTRVS